MKKLRILYLPIWYPDSIDNHAGSFIYDLAHDIADNAHHIDVFYPNMSYKQKGRPLVSLYHHENIVEYLCQGWSLPKNLRIGLESWINKSLRIAKKHLKGKYDIIHTHGYVASFLGPSFQKIFGGKLITTLHHSDIIEQKLTSFRKKKLVNTLINYDKVIVPSQALSKALYGYKIYSSKSYIVPNYIDLDKIKLKSEPNTKTEIFCLSVGSLERVKNYSELVSNWAILDPKFKLDIIGTGPQSRKLKAQILHLNLENQIRIFPPLSKEDLLQRYANYDIFVSMSKVETFGVSMLEAIGAGIPVVTSTTDGPTSFINETNGVICDNIHFIDSLKTTSENLINYNSKALRHSVIKFDKSHIINQIKKIYSSLCVG